MTLLLVFIAAVFTFFTLYKMIIPFMGSRQGQLRVELLDDELRKIELLVARKTALVQSLRELEYDWQTSKVSDEDYQRFKKSYERQAIGIMRRLDAIHGGREWEQSIDNELNRRLDGSADENLASIADTDDVFSKTCEPAAEITCSKCAKPLLAGDAFCSGCGTPVEQNADQQHNADLPQNDSTSNKILRPEITQ